ncbi:MAG: hypothetical protein ACK44N_05350, partial [Bacteroidota bacterium]
MSFKKSSWLILLVVIFLTADVAYSKRPRKRTNNTNQTEEQVVKRYQTSFQSKIDSLEGVTEELEDQKSILLIEMGNRKHKIEKLRSDSANHM